MFPAATAVTLARNVARRGVLVIFCPCVQVLLSLATFSHGLSRSAVTEARRRATVCHGWFYVSFRPATFCWDLSLFCYVAIKFCYVYQVLSRFSPMKCWRWMVFEPQYARGGPQSCCNRYNMHPCSKIVSEYDQEPPQSQTAQPWHREEEPLNHHKTPGIQTKTITCNGNEEADFAFI